MASMKPTLLIFTGLTVALALPAYADFSVGQRVPAPTAAGQSVTSTPTAPFTWTPVTLPYGMNGTGQMAVGGTVDATTRLSVNPQGTAENGLTVNMPTGSTGYAIQIKNTFSALSNTITTTGQSLILSQSGDQYGTTSLILNNRNGSNGAIFNQSNTGAANLVTFGFQVGSGAIRSIVYKSVGNSTYIGDGTPETTFHDNGAGSATLSLTDNSVFLFKPVTVKLSTPSAVGLTLKAASGQTADLLDLNDSTNAVKAKIDKSFGANFPAYNILSGGTTTPGLTTTLADGSAVTGGIVTAPGTAIIGNGSQVAVGGTVDATTRLSVNPQGTSENGLTVKMPNSATGVAMQIVTSTGTKVFGVAPSGAVAAAGYGVGSAVGQTVTVTLAGGAGTLTFIGGILTATSGLTVVNTAEQGYPEATG